MTSEQVHTMGTSGGDWQEIRCRIMGGGPGGMEVLFKCDAESAEVVIWNPFRHEWASLKLKGHGDSPKTENRSVVLPAVWRGLTPSSNWRVFAYAARVI